MDAVRVHWPLLVILLLAGCLLLANLGRAYLWEDEADTALLARSILDHGVPTAWDGVTFIDPDFGQRLTRGFVMVSHPWLQFYAAAASFAVFGDTPWAARFPFALAGLATIAIVYGMVLAFSRNRLAAISAAVLLTLNVQFLLFARQARNYSFNALLTCLLIWQFHRVNSVKRAVWYTATAMLLFHTHPIGLAAVAALALLALVDRRFADVRRWVWLSTIATALYATPWLMAASAGYEQNVNELVGVAQFFGRLLQVVIEWGSVAPIVGAMLLYLGLRMWARWRARSGRSGGTGGYLLILQEQALATACIAVACMDVLVLALTHSRDALWVVGLHHAPALIAIATMLAGVLIAKVGASRRIVWVVFMLLFGFTRIAQLAPWTAWVEPLPARDPNRFATLHVSRTAVGRVFRTAQFHYVQSLFSPDPGVIAHVSEFLRAHAAMGDVVVTNFAWEALYFHTGLPQGAKVSRSFPIYSAARAAKLPEYVFGSDQARWIVWRRAWPAYFEDQNIEEILRRVREGGNVPRLVATIPETLYENRENIHFHRFADGVYVYPFPDALPDTFVYHVETVADAITQYRRSLEGRPDDVVVLTDLAIALVSAGQLDEAVSAFARAAEAAPSNGGAQRNLANALLDSGSVADAARYAERAVILQPRDPAARDVWGRALALQGKLDEARRQFEAALGLDPADAEARDALARIDRIRRESRSDPADRSGAASPSR